MTRILVADDDPTSRLYMGAALQRAGFDVLLAADGHEALGRFAGAACDMVMLDVDMPGASGLEVCATLRAQAGDLLPIVMVTGRDDAQSIDAAYACGATDYLAKPVNGALLGHRVRQLLHAAQAQQALHTAQASQAAMIDAIPDTLMRLDADGSMLPLQVAGAGPSPQPGQTLRNTYPGPVAERLQAGLAQALAGAGVQDCEFWLDGNHGGGIGGTGTGTGTGPGPGRRDFIARIARVGPTQALCLLRDVSDRQRAAHRIARLAAYDSLTGLPNRDSFAQRLSREIQRASWNGTRLATLFMDLDGFKHVNDMLGFEAGDTVLRAAADRLRTALRPSDVLGRGDDAAAPGQIDVALVAAGDARGAHDSRYSDQDAQLARLGGDEFTTLLLDLGDPGHALAVARRIAEQMRKPFVVGDSELQLSASIGIAVYPDDGTDAATLLRHADAAMSHAKAQGRNNCQFYSAALSETARQRSAIEREMRLALAEGQFELAFQPQFNAASGMMCAVEALLRWQHPQRGLLPPLAFTPMAEESGLIVPIGHHALRLACNAAAGWAAAGHPVRVAVNLSPLQVKDPDLVQVVTETLARTGLAPQWLELELTEAALAEDDPIVVAALHALRRLGVELTLDDFGVGYSCLQYLNRLPLTHLKIDRSFVARLPGSADSAAVVSAIVAMAASLNLRVTAEGVETAEQARALVAMGCQGLQGFWAGPPTTATQVARLLAAAPRLALPQTNDVPTTPPPPAVAPEKGLP